MAAVKIDLYNNTDWQKAIDKIDSTYTISLVFGIVTMVFVLAITGLNIFQTYFDTTLWENVKTRPQQSQTGYA